MHIQIRQKFRPFSHTPGVKCLVPFTTWEVEVFPTKVLFRDLVEKTIKERDLDIEGPVNKFTVFLDLERKRVEVSGFGKKGHFRYFLSSESEPFLKEKEVEEKKRRLFFGTHKKQDFDLIRRRGDLKEVFPLWLLLADCIPRVPLPKKTMGTMKLIEQGQFSEAFQAAFSGILSPRLRDESFLGLIPDDPKAENHCPIGLLHEGADQIAALFFFEEDDIWSFLPQLPKEFHAGKFTHIETTLGDIIHMEWSKKELKKVIIHSASSREVHLNMQKSLKSYRLRKSLKQKGVRLSTRGALLLVAGQTLFLDRFQH